ncbi:phospholipid methyltransferase [Mesorhizobium loti]|nr:rRNA adenine N-6-methyltransferase family protein [Mesorhizobium loti]PLP58539.1 phospholipid methyltransferase [Mesorhizobium loti]
MHTNDAFSFLMAWAAAPFRVGSVTPSGATLSALMTKEIGPDTGPVLELGPGTGPFTRALIEKGVREKDLTLIEADSDFAAMLTRRFPAARVFEMDATGLRHLALFNGPVLGAAVSGLPFRLISPRRTRLILEGVFANLRPGASLYQFTLGLRCPIDQTMLDQLDLKATRVGHALRNFPPATVYRISRIPIVKSYDWRYAS